MNQLPAPKLNDLIRQIKRHDFIGRLAIFDPGETTGFALFERGPDHTTLIHAEQLETWPLEKGVPNLHRALSYHPTQCVYEAYHVYAWRLEQHTFSEVPTIQIIGAIKLLLIERNIPYLRQTAQIGKGFCKDDKLESWGLYLSGLVHARDAIRHGCHYLLFGPPKE